MVAITKSNSIKSTASRAETRSLISKQSSRSARSYIDVEAGFDSESDDEIDADEKKQDKCCSTKCKIIAIGSAVFLVVAGATYGLYVLCSGSSTPEPSPAQLSELKLRMDKDYANWHKHEDANRAALVSDLAKAFGEKEESMTVTGTKAGSVWADLKMPSSTVEKISVAGFKKIEAAIGSDVLELCAGDKECVKNPARAGGKKPTGGDKDDNEDDNESEDTTTGVDAISSAEAAMNMEAMYARHMGEYGALDKSQGVTKEQRQARYDAIVRKNEGDAAHKAKVQAALKQLVFNAKHPWMAAAGKKMFGGWKTKKIAPTLGEREDSAQVPDGAAGTARRTPATKTEPAADPSLGKVIDLKAKEAKFYESKEADEGDFTADGFDFDFGADGAAIIDRRYEIARSIVDSVPAEKLTEQQKHDIAAREAAAKAVIMSEDDEVAFDFNEADSVPFPEPVKKTRKGKKVALGVALGGLALGGGALAAQPHICDANAAGAVCQGLGAARTQVAQTYQSGAQLAQPHFDAGMQFAQQKYDAHAKPIIDDIVTRVRGPAPKPLTKAEKIQQAAKDMYAKMRGLKTEDELAQEAAEEAAFWGMKKKALSMGKKVRSMMKQE